MILNLKLEKNNNMKRVITSLQFTSIDNNMKLFYFYQHISLVDIFLAYYSHAHEEIDIHSSYI